MVASCSTSLRMMFARLLRRVTEVLSLSRCASAVTCLSYCREHGKYICQESHFKAMLMRHALHKA